MMNKTVIYSILFSLLLLQGCGTPMMTRSPSGYYYAFNSKKACEDEQKYGQESMERRQKYIDEHPELDKKTINKIWTGYVEEGDTKELALIIYGKPNSIEFDKTKNVEKWIYGYVPHSWYLYFKDEKLIKPRK